MEKVMICLIGEQPVPNLLPIRHCQPRQVALVFSDKTGRVKDNLGKMLKDFSPVGCRINPYDIIEAERQLREFIEQQNWQATDLLFNLTGGTKPMSLAAFRLAQSLGSPVIYLQSEGGKSLLYCYEFQNGTPILRECAELGEMLTIQDYFGAHGLTGYQLDPRSQPFEVVVLDALKSHVSEIVRGIRVGSLEIDLTIRCGNQVGVAEVKTGKKAEKKEGVDQVNTAAQREFLGTYTRRFLILDRHLETNNRVLAEAQGITVIELLDDWSATGKLSDANAEMLVTTVTKALGAK